MPMGYNKRTGPWSPNTVYYFVPVAAVIALLATGCVQQPTSTATSLVDPQLAAHGTIELTARLMEVPDGSIFKRDLYDYATILKYQVLKVHRGEVKEDVIYVGHYNPWKPRNEAKDRRVTNIGGNLRQFQAGQTHRMALEEPIEDFFMGGIVDKYFGKKTDMPYWAVWTNLE